MFEIEFHSSRKYRSLKIDLYRVTGAVVSHTNRTSPVVTGSALRSVDSASYEVIVIDCLRIPPDMEGMRKYLDQYIIPD